MEYTPPMSEFNMLKIALGKGEEEEIESIGGPSILVATDGSGKMTAEGKEYELKAGYVFFVGHGIVTKYQTADRLTIYSAYAE